MVAFNGLGSREGGATRRARIEAAEQVQGTIWPSNWVTSPRAWTWSRCPRLGGVPNRSARDLRPVAPATAARIDLRRYRKSRQALKTAPKRVHDPQRPHVSVARLLAQRG
ncbi:MAG: hypothetical protein H6976_00520 [Gammaproteobacteria bacterium]|nr:hypothetical protein [Gammaproteobacteria bacterium]